MTKPILSVASLSERTHGSLWKSMLSICYCLTLYYGSLMMRSTRAVAEWFQQRCHGLGQVGQDKCQIFYSHFLTKVASVLSPIFPSSPSWLFLMSMSSSGHYCRRHFWQLSESFWSFCRSQRAHQQICGSVIIMESKGGWGGRLGRPAGGELAAQSVSW